METPCCVDSQILPGIGPHEEDADFLGLRKRLFSPETGGGGDGRLNEPVSVYLRVRPKSKEEIQSKDRDCIHCSGDREVVAIPPESSNTYKCNRNGETAQTFEFSQIFPESTSQKHLFEETLRPRLKDVCEGQDCLLFTYGVTNSGKSFTIVGNQAEPGLLPRALDVLFSSLDVKGMEEFRYVPERFSELRRVRDQEEFEERVRQKERLLQNARNIKCVSHDGISVASSNPSEEDTMADVTNSSTVSSITNVSSNTSKISAVSGDSQMEGSRVDDFIQVHEEGFPLEIVNGADCQFAMFVSFTEIYNNLVYDLLAEPPETSKHRPSLKIQQDKNQNNFIKGLQEVPVCNTDEAMLILHLGLRHRHVAATKLNYESSRGHAIFSIKLVKMASCAEKPTKAFISRISIVDLAGAERSTKSGATGTRMTEANSINKDLFTLGRCIRSMMDNQNKRSADVVPFRETNLTKLFQNYFVGREESDVKRRRHGMVSMFVNISCCASTFDHTLQVLKFSSIASKVVPTVKQVVQTPRPVQPSRLNICTPATLTKTATKAETTAHKVSSDTGSYCSNCRHIEKELQECQQSLQQYKQVVDRQFMQVEFEIRKELGKEYSEKIVELEKEHRQELEETERDYESMMDERIRIVQKSVKKRPRKRRREEEEQEMDEEDKENFEARVLELEEELARQKDSASARLQAVSQEYETSMQALREQLSGESEKLAEVGKREAQLAATTDSLRKEVLSMVEENKQLLRKVQESEEVRADLLGKVRELEESVSTATEQGKAEVEILEERISELQVELEEAAQSRSSEKVTLLAELGEHRAQEENELRQKIQELEESLESARHDGVVDGLKVQVSELQAEVVTVTKEKEKAVRRLEENLEHASKEKEAEMGRLKDSLAELAREKEIEHSSYLDMEKKARELEENLEAVRMSCQSRETSWQETEASLKRDLEQACSARDRLEHEAKETEASLKRDLQQALSIRDRLDHVTKETEASLKRDLEQALSARDRLEHEAKETEASLKRDLEQALSTRDRLEHEAKETEASLKRDLQQALSARDRLEQEAKEAMEHHQLALAELRENRDKLASLKSESDQSSRSVLTELEQANIKLLGCEEKCRQLSLERDVVKVELGKEREEIASLKQEVRAREERLVQMEGEWQLKGGEFETELAGAVEAKTLLEKELEECKKCFEMRETELLEKVKDCDQRSSEKIASLEDTLSTKMEDYQKQLHMKVKECESLTLAIQQEKELICSLQETVRTQAEAHQLEVQEVRQSMTQRATEHAHEVAQTEAALNHEIQSLRENCQQQVLANQKSEENVRALKSKCEEKQSQIVELQKELDSMHQQLQQQQQQDQSPEGMCAGLDGLRSGSYDDRCEGEEEHIYEEPPELTTPDRTVYESVLDDTLTSRSSKMEVAMENTVPEDPQTSGQMADEPSQNKSLMEISMEQPKIVIDATPLSLRKKAAKRKRKNEYKNGGTKKYTLRNRSKMSASKSPPPEPSDAPDIATQACGLNEELGERSPALKKLKNNLAAGKKVLSTMTTRSKRKLRKQDSLAANLSVESPTQRATRVTGVRLGGKLEKLQRS